MLGEPQTLAFSSSSFPNELGERERENLLNKFTKYIETLLKFASSMLSSVNNGTFKLKPAATYRFLSGAKWFSHVYTLSLSINLWKYLSTSCVFVSSFSHCSRHCLYLSFLKAGSFHISIPLVFLLDPCPNTAQLSPGISCTLVTSLMTI